MQGCTSDNLMQEINASMSKQIKMLRFLEVPIFIYYTDKGKNINGKIHYFYLYALFSKQVYVITYQIQYFLIFAFHFIVLNF